MNKCIDCDHKKVCSYQSYRESFESKLPDNVLPFSAEVVCSEFSNCQRYQYQHMQQVGSATSKMTT
jgi:hypothetical protein